MAMKPHLLVFAKRPKAGEAKTRLCPPLSPAQAAAVAEALLRDTLPLAEHLTGWERTLAYAPRGARREMAALAPPWRLRLQRGSDLGARLEHAFAGRFAQGAGPVVAIGADCPHMPAGRVEEAAAALEQADLVLGPTDDGGFYLIGLRRAAPGLFEGVRWSTEHALGDTLAQARRLRLRYGLLSPGYDVDEMEDLGRLRRALPAMPAGSLAHTRAVLEQLAGFVGPEQR
jgi:uncharacterized protein